MWINAYFDKAQDVKAVYIRHVNVTDNDDSSLS